MADWSAEEDEFLKENYGKMTAHECALQLVNRNRMAVIGRAGRLGLSSDIQRARPERIAPLRPVKKVPNPVGWAPQQRIALANTSVAERANGMGMTKQVVLREASIDLADLKCEPVSLMDRRDDQCCWPLDDGMYCGLLKPKRQPYCPAHQHAQTDHTRKYRRGIWVSPKL